MKLRHIASTALIASAAFALAIGFATPSDAKSKGKKAAAAAAQLHWPLCNTDAKQVCAEKGGMRSTFANACWARNEGAKVVSQGECKTRGGKKKRG